MGAGLFAQSISSLIIWMEQLSLWHEAVKDIEWSLKASGFLCTVRKGTALIIGSLERSEVSKRSGRVLERAREREKQMFMVNQLKPFPFFSFLMGWSYLSPSPRALLSFSSRETWKMSRNAGKLSSPRASDGTSLLGTTRRPSVCLLPAALATNTAFCITIHSALPQEQNGITATTAHQKQLNWASTSYKNNIKHTFIYI